MPAVSLTLRQISTPLTVDGGATYRVENEVTASFGIDKAVFVFKTDTQAFSHYATPVDMDALPTSHAQAVADGVGFYRQTSVTRTWTTISAMNEDVAMTQARLRALARETSKIQGSITVDQTVVIEAA